MAYAMKKICLKTRVRRNLFVAMQWVDHAEQRSVTTPRRISAHQLGKLSEERVYVGWRNHYACNHEDKHKTKENGDDSKLRPPALVASCGRFVKGGFWGYRHCFSPVGKLATSIAHPFAAVTAVPIVTALTGHSWFKSADQSFAGLRRVLWKGQKSLCLGPEYVLKYF
jgi:hypothetical protein